jgi:hypothetical protein
MKASQLILAALAATLILGCNGQAKPDPTAKESDKPSPDGTAAKPLEPVAALKHAGFDYLGFGRTEPYTYEFSKMEGVTPVSGVQTTELVDASDKAAKYQVLRTGGLEELGSEDFEVRADGVYSTRMSLGTLEKPMLIMPADVSVGKTWTGEFTSTDAAGRKVTFKVTNKAEKEEKIKVKGGEFDALLVTTNGTISIAEEGKTGTGTVSTKTWYSKGVGQLRMQLELKKPEGSNVKSFVELVKIGK